MTNVAARQLVLAELDRLFSHGTGRFVLACVEGLGGSGKSTLANDIAHSRPDVVTVVHGDDFYGPEERDWRSWSAEEGYLRYLDHRRLEQELLQPLRRGETAQFRRYDWSTQAMGGLVEVRPTGIVLVEGVYLLREYLRPYWDFSVYVDVPRDVRLARLYARGENDAGWIARWAAAEDHYEAVEHPAGAADLIVVGH
jgi:uridine kinase